MTALRMDGTTRPKRSDDTQALMRKLAREWFKAHPKCRIVFHWRRDEMTGVNRELLDSIRIADVRGKRVVFGVALNGGTQSSELSLDDLTSVDIGTGNLLIEFVAGPTCRIRASLTLAAYRLALESPPSWRAFFV